MPKEKTYGKNDLIEFYFKCPLFKKYCQYNLWFGSFNEYVNIKYCKKYIHRYIRLSIEKFVLQHFNLSILFVLYASPRFTKFVKSGVFKYLDFHFLLLFYNNCFNCSLKNKKTIENFVHEYFKKYVKNVFIQDLLICIDKSIDELPSNSFKLHLVNRIRYAGIKIKRSSLDRKSLSKAIKYECNIKNREMSPFFTNYLIKDLFYGIAFNSKQLCLKSDNDYRLFSNLASFFNCILFKLQLKKSYLLFIKSKFIKLNKDIQNLSERLEILSVLYIGYKSVGLYKKLDIFFDNNLYYKCAEFNKSFKNFNSLLKSFNSSFTIIKYL